MPRPRLLYVDVKWPRPDRDAASRRASQLLTALVDMGFEVRIGATDPTEPMLPSALGGADPLPAIGEEAVREHLERQGDRYRVVVAAWTRLAQRFADTVRRAAPHAAFVFDTVDVNHIREYRHAKVTGNLNLLRRAMAMKTAELDGVRAADLTLAVTETDAQVLRQGVPGAAVSVVAMAAEARTTPVPGPEGRRGMLFLGNLHAWHNVDAILHLCHDVLPRVRRERPAIQALIAGAGHAEPLDVLAGEPGVVRLGAVPELEPVFDRARLFACPLRVGSGVKGKLLDALSLGLPIVTTSIGAEGMGLRDGEHCLIADVPDGFADAVVRLDRDDALWRRLSASGRELVETRYGAAVIDQQVRAAFGRFLEPDAARSVAAHDPEAVVAR